MDTRDTKCRWHRCDIFLLGLTSKSGHPILYCPGTNHKALDTQRRRRLKKQSAKEMRQYRTKRASKTSNRYQIPITKDELSGIVGYARVGASRIPVRGWIKAVGRKQPAENRGSTKAAGSAEGVERERSKTPELWSTQVTVSSIRLREHRPGQ
jgi:hypothetical protein